MSPRLDRMSLREIEDAGQRWYALRGALLGEQDDPVEEGDDSEPVDPGVWGDDR